MGAPCWEVRWCHFRSWSQQTVLLLAWLFLSGESYAKQIFFTPISKMKSLSGDRQLTSTSFWKTSTGPCSWNVDKAPKLPSHCDGRSFRFQRFRQPVPVEKQPKWDVHKWSMEGNGPSSLASLPWRPTTNSRSAQDKNLFYWSLSLGMKVAKRRGKSHKVLLLLPFPIKRHFTEDVRLTHSNSSSDPDFQRGRTDPWNQTQGQKSSPRPTAKPSSASVRRLLQISVGLHLRALK